MKILFCSCCKLQSFTPQPVWGKIQQERPDALLLLGDNVYLDHDQHGDPKKPSAELQQKYANQFAEPNFVALLSDMASRGAPVFATYDNHDFLGNNRYGGDHDPGLAEAARQEPFGHSARR